MKVLKYIVLVLGIIVWAVGLSPALLRQAGEWKLIRDGYQYGDLYRLANLSEFKDPHQECPPYTPPARTKSSRKVHLYIIGDSFTEKQRVGKQDFVVDEYDYVHWDYLQHIKLDTSEINILLLESVERHFRQKKIYPLTTLVPDTATFVTELPPPNVISRIDNAFRSRSTEDRIDAFLFQNELALRVKQLKADLNYYFFGRVNESVAVVNDGRSLVTSMDTDTSKIMSSFSTLKQTEVDSLVTILASAHKFADSLGFDHMVLSIIPNKTSVVDPGRGEYNELIRRVYNHPKLGMPVIDVLGDFRKMGVNSYLKGDSHWTCQGENLWLNKVNATINQLVGSSPLLPAR